METVRVERILTDKIHRIQTASGETFTSPRKLLFFLYGPIRLQLVLYHDDHQWKPATFFHVSEEVCPFCKMSGKTECEAAVQYLDTLFQEVMDSKPFRLQALYEFA